MQVDQLDPFANMVPLHQMEEEIEYQMICDEGFDPEDFYHTCVENKERGLRENVDEVTAQLWANIHHTFSIFSATLEKMRNSCPYRAAAMQTEQLVNNMKVLEREKENNLVILKELNTHLQKAQAQQKIYQEKLLSLKAAQRKQQANSPFANFICQVGERYRQAMINQSAGISALPPVERPSGSAASGEINQKEISFNHQRIGT